jgi:hypothetical protein
LPFRGRCRRAERHRMVEVVVEVEVEAEEKVRGCA